MSVAPDTTDEVVADLKRGLERIKARRPEYDKREQYQLGTRKEVIAHPALESLLEKYGEDFKLNYAGVPSVALNDRVDLLALRTGDTAADTLLVDRFWMPNGLDDDADDIHLKAFYLGDYYGVLEVVEDEDDQIDATDETSTGIGTVELTPKDPRSTVIIYQRANSRIPDFGVQVVSTSELGEFTAYVYYDDETWRFATKPANPKDSDGLKVDEYVLDLEADEDGVPLPIPGDLGGFPLLHWRPDSRPYGTPVNLNAYGPQDSITKLVATLMASVDYHGLPERYSLLDPSRETGDDIAHDFNDDLPADGSNATAKKGKPKLNSRPGGMSFLEGVTETGTYATSDPAGFTNPMGMFIRAAATLTRTPLYEFDLDGSGDQPSGEARRRADGPITKHGKKVMGQFGAVWAAGARWTLKSLGQDAARKVEAVWAPAETATDKDGIELATAKVATGVPPRQALAEAGYTQDQLKKWFGDSEVVFTPTMLAVIGTALQALGQARGLGAVNPEDIAAVLGQFFGSTSTPEPDPIDEPPAA